MNIQQEFDVSLLYECLRETRGSTQICACTYVRSKQVFLVFLLLFFFLGTLTFRVLECLLKLLANIDELTISFYADLSVRDMMAVPEVSQYEQT